MISVNGQTADFSSSFNKGAWVSFPISKWPRGNGLDRRRHARPGQTPCCRASSWAKAGPRPRCNRQAPPRAILGRELWLAGYDLAAWNGTATCLDPERSGQPGAGQPLRVGLIDERRAGPAEPRRPTREAATYYDPNQIRLSLKFNSAYSGNLHLYALDWDSTARRELISVDGQTADLSSSFNQGAWVSFPISVAAGETVSIVVDRTAGANAVLSGIFLG
jgi:hypothetical protein